MSLVSAGLIISLEQPIADIELNAPRPMTPDISMDLMFIRVVPILQIGSIIRWNSFMNQIFTLFRRLLKLCPQLPLCDAIYTLAELHKGIEGFDC